MNLEEPHHHYPHLDHMRPAFGSDAFGRKAEAFARFFGTPTFLIGQSIIVGLWIIINAAAMALRWDPYPFILLNLMFSLQAAYAAPLILLAQTRQADRDKALSDADKTHREQLADAARQGQEIAVPSCIPFRSCSRRTPLSPNRWNDLHPKSTPGS